jgi:5-methylcytosine-specific restriction endonuclease McrA
VAAEPLVPDLAFLLARASMSASYKPALLKALVRIVRAHNELQVSLETIGHEFAKMYWNQTVVFRLRQAASLTKTAEVIKPIDEAAKAFGVRYFGDLPDEAKSTLRKRMARILTINVLEAFHTSKPASMPRLYEWNKGSDVILLNQEAYTLLQHNGMALEAIANYFWADFLEAINRLTPRIVQKVKRDGIEHRRSLTRFLNILMDFGDMECFYCRDHLGGASPPTVDHVIPWSFLVDDPLWDLVLACSHCNGSKSDTLPNEIFIDKLLRRNAALSARSLAKAASALVSGDDIVRVYRSALTANWPADWAPQTMR